MHTPPGTSTTCVVYPINASIPPYLDVHCVLYDFHISRHVYDVHCAHDHSPLRPLDWVSSRSHNAMNYDWIGLLVSYHVEHLLVFCGVGIHSTRHRRTRMCEKKYSSSNREHRPRRGRAWICERQQKMSGSTWGTRRMSWACMD